jgi:hypothetical protein
MIPEKRSLRRAVTWLAGVLFLVIPPPGAGSNPAPAWDPQRSPISVHVLETPPGYTTDRGS